MVLVVGGRAAGVDVPATTLARLLIKRLSQPVFATAGRCTSTSAAGRKRHNPGLSFSAPSTHCEPHESGILSRKKNALIPRLPKILAPISGGVMPDLEGVQVRRKAAVAGVLWLMIPLRSSRRLMAEYIKLVTTSVASHLQRLVII